MLSWGANITLLEKLKDPVARLWYGHRARTEQAESRRGQAALMLSGR